MKKLIEANGFLSRDPYVFKHNGKYYRLFSHEAEALYMTCAPTIEGLRTAREKLVYAPEPGKAYSKHLWASELHIIDGKCYIYFAADDGNTDNHRMYVLENGSDDPMEPYTLHGKITDDTDKYAIDGTVMHHNGSMYFIWSGREGDTCVFPCLGPGQRRYPVGKGRFVACGAEKTQWQLCYRINSIPYGIAIGALLVCAPMCCK